MSLDVARSLLVEWWRERGLGERLSQAALLSMQGTVHITCGQRQASPAGITVSLGVSGRYWGWLVCVCLHSSDMWPHSDLAGLEGLMVSTEPRPWPRSPHCHPRGTSPPSAGLRSLPMWEDMASVPWSPSGTRVLTWPANLHSPLGPASSTSWAAGRPLATLSTDETFSVLTLTQKHMLVALPAVIL